MDFYQMKEALQQISVLKPYRVHFGCKENKCEYSQLIINLIKNSKFDSGVFVVSKENYDLIVNEYEKVFDLYAKDAYKDAFTSESDKVSIDLDAIHESDVTTKIALYFLFNKHSIKILDNTALFLLRFLNLDICQSLMEVEDYQSLVNTLFPCCEDYIKQHSIWCEINQQNLIDYVHSVYEKEITHNAIIKYDLSNAKAIYTSVFRIDDYGSFFIDDEQCDEILACIRFIVKSYLFLDKHEKVFIDLLDFAKDKNFVLLYLLFEHIRDLNPRILTDLLSDPDYGVISINLTYDYLVRLLEKKKELQIDEKLLTDIFTANVKEFTKNQSHMIPAKKKFDVVKDISFILCSAYEYYDKNKANPQTASFQKKAIESLENTIVDAFTVKGNFRRDNLVPMAEELLLAPEIYFSDIAKLNYTVFFYNYYSQIGVEAKLQEQYSEKINALFDTILHQNNFFDSAFDTVDFTNYLTLHEYDKTFLPKALDAINENSTLFYHYRNLSLLKIGYNFYLQRQESFKNNGYFEYSIKLIQKCFLTEPNGYIRTLDLLDKSGKYKENVIEMLDYICSASKKYELAYKNLTNELPYKLKFFVFNTSKNKEILALLEEYLSDVKIDEVTSDVNYLPDLIKFTIDVYNSHLNKTLAKELLDKLHKFISSRFSEKKEYQILLKELDIFDAYINSDEARLDSYNKSDLENELRMYYKSILLLKKKEYEIPHKYMSFLVEKYPEKIDYKILLLQVKQAMGEKNLLQDCDELLKTVQEGEDD